MTDQLLNSRWTKLLFALSVTTFVGLQISITSRIAMFISIPFAFAITLIIQYKFKILDKVFAVKSKKYMLISLPISIYSSIEVVLNFHCRILSKMFVSNNTIAVHIRSLFTEPIIKLGLFIFSFASLVAVLFSVFLIVYAIVSRFRKLIIRLWIGTELLEKVYFVLSIILFGTLVALCYRLSPIFWGDNKLPWKGINFIFDLDIGYNFSEDVQFYFPSANIKKLFFPLVNLPFAVVARAFGRILSFIPFSFVYFVQLFHIGLMAVCGILLARMCNVKGFSKLSFLLIYTVSYPFLLFSIPCERYILPTFCIILLMFVCIYAPRNKYAAALAAAGTLTTSIVAFPFITYDKNIKTWFLNLIKLCGCFLAICTLCGVLALLINPVQSILGQLKGFAGGVSIDQKAFQFINFIGSCFVKPETELIFRTDGKGIEFITYALAMPNAINWVGVLMITLSIAGFIVNRKQRFAQMSFLWASFAFFVLFVLGWAAKGNEMFLTSYYFSWAFIALVFLLFEKLPNKLKILKYSIFISAFVVMSIINIRGIIDLIKFGIQYYPA